MRGDAFRQPASSSTSPPRPAPSKLPALAASLLLSNAGLDPSFLASWLHISAEAAARLVSGAAGAAPRPAAAEQQAPRVEQNAHAAAGESCLVRQTSLVNARSCAKELVAWRHSTPSAA